jgi:3-oxoacyl-[acyl-carrier-protein] synthase-1
MQPMQPLRISHFTLTSALGRGLAAQRDALLAERSGLRPCDFETTQLPAWIGRVAGLEDEPLPAEWRDHDCRNNRLAYLALQQDGFTAAVAAARERYGAARIGLFLGTSTSGIHETEIAYRQIAPDSGRLPVSFNYRYAHNVFSASYFVGRYLGLRGPATMVSTACSSSAKVFAIAHRHIEAGWCDAAVVGGVDSLCLTTLYGFTALQVVSPQACRPADAARDGISIGEAAGFALLERAAGRGDFALLGYGESSDAHHMSTPEPEGAGAALAMQTALARAGLEAGAVDYINLHGTATPANDIAEDKAVCPVFGTQTRCSSTKGWTGHALGAAGITEAVISLLALQEGWLPRSLNTRELDPAIRGQVLLASERLPVRRVLSNSFGFGGNNCSLLLGTAA